MMVDESKLIDIFCSNNQNFRADKQIIVNILFLLENGLLKLKEEQYSDKKIFNVHLDKINNGEIPIVDIEGGQAGHLALKLITKDYLISRGYKDNKFELEFEGYRPDLITNDKKIIVECGTINPDKVFNYFKNESLRELIVIPYPDKDEEFIYLYIFTPGKDLPEFLEYYNAKIIEGAKNFNR